MKSLISNRKEKPVSVKGLSNKMLKDALKTVKPKLRSKVEKEISFRGI